LNATLVTTRLTAPPLRGLGGPLSGTSHASRRVNAPYARTAVLATFAIVLSLTSPLITYPWAVYLSEVLMPNVFLSIPIFSIPIFLWLPQLGDGDHNIDGVVA